MRRSWLVLGVGCALLAVARADEPPDTAPVKPKLDLSYRFDLLDGRKAVYDVATESSSTQSFKGRTTDEEGRERLEDAIDVVTLSTKARRRVVLAFARAPRDRGRVTFTVESLDVTHTRVSGEKTETWHYDSTKTPPGEAPEELKATVATGRPKPYTLTLSRRGEVEAVEGKPRSELDSLRGDWLVLAPETRAEGEGWNVVHRLPVAYGSQVTKVAYKLAKVDESAKRALAEGGERSIEGEIKVELSLDRSRTGELIHAAIENPSGSHRVLLDARGLRIEDAWREAFELVVQDPKLIKRIQCETSATWKLVELRESEKK